MLIMKRSIEAEAIADEFNRLMSTSTYKGKNIFVTTAGGEYVSMGGRDAEMTFGLGTIIMSTLQNFTMQKGLLLRVWVRMLVQLSI